MKKKRKQWSKGIVFLLILAICFGTPFLQLPTIEAQAASTTEEPDPSGDYTYTISDDNTVTIIGYNGNASELQIPAEIDGHPVTGIAGAAFMSCISMTSIEIPDSVTSIAVSAFLSCQSLSEINVDLNNTVYASVAGVLFNKEKTTVILCPQKKEGTYSIPDSVTSIGDMAFHWCYGLTDIEIPDSVTSIGNSAFEGCGSLTRIEIPDSVTSIGDNAFLSCQSLSEINVDLNNTAYASVAGVLFNKEMTTVILCPQKKEGAYSIPDSVTSIEHNTFNNCYGLTSIEIPDGVTSIGDSAFGSCDGLTSIKIPDGVTSIRDDTFNSCSSLTNIEIPDSLTSIGDRAFAWCSSLAIVVLPETVTHIGASAFAQDDLQNITIPAKEIEIAEDAFFGCKNLTIRCYEASQAQAFAQAHEIKVELLKEKPTVVYGDLDESGSVDANDALVILKIAAKLQTPTEEQSIAGDVDDSGSVDANDALYVLQKAAKLIDVFPIEAK